MTDDEAARQYVVNHHFDGPHAVENAMESAYLAGRNELAKEYAATAIEFMHSVQADNKSTANLFGLIFVVSSFVALILLGFAGVGIVATVNYFGGTP